MTARTIDGDKLRARIEKAHDAEAGKEPTAAQKTAAEKAVRGALLTREQVQELVPYDLAWARDYTTRPFRWGYVLSSAGPLTGSGTPLLKALAEATGMDLSAATGMDLEALTTGPHSEPYGAAKTSPTSVLLYGDGFGAIVLAQTTTTPDLQKQLEQAGQASQILGSATVNGAKALEVGTPLGGIIVWQQGDTTLVAGGMVPMSDLEAFASSVR